MNGRMLNAYDNIIISSLSQGLNETSAHVNSLWHKVNLGKMLAMLLEKKKYFPKPHHSSQVKSSTSSSQRPQ